MADSRRPIITIDLEAMVEAANRFRDAVDHILAPAPAPDRAKAPEEPLPPLVGMGGPKEHGKSTFARFLVQDHGYFETYMAEPLNEALRLVGPEGPWVKLDKDVHGPKPVQFFPAGSFMRLAELQDWIGYDASKAVSRDVREYLQGLGTEVGRNMLGETVWLDIAKEKILQARAAGSPVVITGIRYQNELELIRELGGLSAWIERPYTAPEPHPLTDAIDAAIAEEFDLALPAPDTTATHSSETSLTAEDFDVFIDNMGTLDQLRAMASALHHEILDGIHDR